MSAWLIVPAMYVLGGVLTGFFSAREWLREFPSRNFGDFAGSVMIGGLFAALVWPLFAVTYLGWRMYRRAA